MVAYPYEMMHRPQYLINTLLLRLHTIYMLTCHLLSAIRLQGQNRSQIGPEIGYHGSPKPEGNTLSLGETKC